MSPRNISDRLKRLEASWGPRCQPAREIVSRREGEPMPDLPRCPHCGERGCGVIVVEEVIVTTREEADAVRRRNEAGR